VWSVYDRDGALLSDIVLPPRVSADGRR
jgi:hypothetical protein